MKSSKVMKALLAQPEVIAKSGEQLDEYLSEEAVAAILLLKKSTLTKNRCVGKNHPPFIKVGGRVLYPKTLLAKWLHSLPIHRAANEGNENHE